MRNMLYTVRASENSTLVLPLSLSHICLFSQAHARLSGETCDKKGDNLKFKKEELLFFLTSPRLKRSNLSYFHHDC